MAIIGVSGKLQSGKDTVTKILQYRAWQDIYGNLSSANKFDFLSFEKKYDRHELLTVFDTKRFADKVKDIVCILINCTRKDLENIEFKNKPLGKKWIRWYGVNYKLSNNNSDGRITHYYTSEEALKEDVVYDLLTKVTDIRSEILTPRKLMQLVGTEAGRDIIHPDVWVNSLLDSYEKDIENNVKVNWIIPDTRFINEAMAIRGLQDSVTIRVNSDKRVPSTSDHPSETGLDNYEHFDYYIDNNGTLEELIESVTIIWNKIKHKVAR